MKDIDNFINTYIGTGRYGQDREDEKDRATSKLTNLLKEAFEAGRKQETVECNLLGDYKEPTYRTFADYLKTKL